MREQHVSLEEVVILVEEPIINIRDRVSLESSRTALIVVDMQNDFVHPKGRLFVPKARDTIPAIASLISRARKKKIPIIYTQDWHYTGDPEEKVWGAHAIAGTWGSEIIEELRPLEGDIIVRKPSYDAFYSTPLDHILRNTLKRDTLVVVGTVANICVLHTVAGAAMRWYRTVVPLDGISALNDYDFKLSLRQMDFLYKTVLVRSVEGIYFT